METLGLELNLQERVLPIAIRNGFDLTLLSAFLLEEFFIWEVQALLREALIQDKIALFVSFITVLNIGARKKFKPMKAQSQTRTLFSEVQKYMPI